MKYIEATKLIEGLSKKYSTDNNGTRYFEIIYKSKSIAWVNKQERFNFGNSIPSSFESLPYSHKLWMIQAELAMTSLDKRKDEHKWNVIVGNDNSKIGTIVAWEKSLSGHGYELCFDEPNHLIYDGAVFTDDEFNDLIKHIKTLPDGKWQAKVAEHGKTLVKGE